MVLLAREKIDLGVPRHHRVLLLPRREARTAKSVIQGTPPLSRLSGVDVHGLLYDRCCGLDIHKQTVVACMLLPGAGRQPAKEIRTFGTMTADLLELGDWLAEKGVTHVALESTGVYWHAVWNLLEGNVELLLVNAQHIKQCLVGRRMRVIVSGSRICCVMGYYGRVSCLSVLNGNCGSSLGTGQR